LGWRCGNFLAGTEKPVPIAHCKGDEMNLRSYYQKIREMAESLPAGDVWVESLATRDGGKAGMFTQVPRQLAAKLIVDGKARLADSEIAVEAERRRNEVQLARPGVERMVVTLSNGDKAKKPKG
jgi:hypothetical protein